MKNLKKYNINSNKKYKIVKGLSRVLAGTLLIANLTGCSINFKKNKGLSNNTYSQYTQSEIDSHLEFNDNESYAESNDNEFYDSLNEKIVLDELSKAIIDSDIKLNSSDIIEFINYVDTIKVDYPNSDLFNTLENFSKYKSLDKYRSTSDNIFKNGYITDQYIYNIVLKNNEQENFSKTAIMQDSDIKQICSIIAETLNYCLKNNLISDYNLLSEKIFQLKIKKFEGFSNGSYDSKTCIMGFDINKLNSDKDLLKKVVEHETYHLIQSNSLGEINNSNLDLRLGFCYKFNDSTVNSLYLKWFTEGSADMLVMNQNNIKEPLTYGNYTKHIDIIKAATLLNDNNKTNDLESLSLDFNLDNLFHYFDCKNENNKEEILNLMFSYEIISKTSGDSSREEFYKAYEKLNGEIDYKTESLFEKQLKGSIGQTLTKLFYKNLANKIKDKDVKICEIFELISVFESVLNRQTWYATTGYASIISDFMKNYTQIQKSFFEILAKKTNLSVTDLENAYNAYNSYLEIDIDELDYLSSLQKEFYNYIKNEVKDDKTYSIKYVYDKELKKQKYK